jgi:hypothetical protein
MKTNKKNYRLMEEKIFFTYENNLLFEPLLLLFESSAKRFICLSIN